MKIEFDFRADMTVCELVQYLYDELQNEARHTDYIIGQNKCDEMSHWRIEGCLQRENKLCDLIDDICLKAHQADYDELV